VVAQPITEHENGYTIRSHDVLRAQRAIGIEAEAFRGDWPGLRGDIELDGVCYTQAGHGPEDPRYSGVRSTIMRACADRRLASDRSKTTWLSAVLGEQINRQRPEILHAHSPQWLAVATMQAARSAGIPWVYERRGLQEESAIEGGKMVRGGSRHRAWVAGESLAVRSARHVFAIGAGLAESARELGARSVSLALNCVDTTVFCPGSDDGLRERIFGADRGRGLIVIGYIGSLRDLEGVDALLVAIKTAASADTRIRGLIVGDGDAYERLRRLTSELGLARLVIFSGRVPRSETPKYHRAVDVFAVTRPDLRVTREVTPMKPLEALATGSRLVMSDLPALREMAGDCAHYYRPGDTEDLVRALRSAIGSGPDTRGRDLMIQHRSWGALAARYRDVYEEILS